ncbi:pyridoxamine 5'-phosphate oxidase family protein [Rhodococcus sp. NPDC059968]|uniref:pyridoxamine 5'-phosphate oxidase family protein n=1 Tax=Rhodococcus sp. NPDC059968 TaxID=3347017 RepID=UPI00366D57FD
MRASLRRSQVDVTVTIPAGATDQPRIRAVVSGRPCGAREAGDTSDDVVPCLDRCSARMLETSEGPATRTGHQGLSPGTVSHHRGRAPHRRECLGLLRSVPVGRLVYTEDALPAVRPVPFAAPGGQFVIPTSDNPWFDRFEAPSSVSRSGLSRR